MRFKEYIYSASKDGSLAVMVVEVISVVLLAVVVKTTTTTSLEYNKDRSRNVAVVRVGIKERKKTEKKRMSQNEEYEEF